MARFLVEILINAAGGPKARASFDDVGASAASAAKRIEQSGLQSERALRRTAEAAERLKDQMEETKASKGLIADLQTMNRRTQEQIASLREGAAGLERYQQKEIQAAQAARILAAQVKAGVAAHSIAGKEIADQIRLHDKLQAELLQTAKLQNLDMGAGGAGRMSVLVSSARSFMATAAGVAASLVGVGYSVKKLTDAAAESEGVLAQLRAGLISTGGASGQTVQSLSDLADEISRLTGQDDELIASGEAVLLTFTKISGDVFPAATKAALDMSVRMKQDLNSAILQVGKALNDPVKGVTALTKAGIQFTEPQKELIKTLVQTGNLLGAQRIILKELETQFGGSAVAARDTLGGALTAVQTETGNLIETLASGLSPVIRDLAEDYIAWAQSAEAQKQMAEWGKLLADAVSGVAEAAKLAAPALKLMGMEAKVILTIISPLLQGLGWLADKIKFAQTTYLDFARSIVSSQDDIASIDLSAADAEIQGHMGAVYDLRRAYGELGQAALEAAQKQLASMTAQAEILRRQAADARKRADDEKGRRRAVGGRTEQAETFASNTRVAQYTKEAREAEEAAKNLDNIVAGMTARFEEHQKAAAGAADETEDYSGSLKEAREAFHKMMKELVDSEAAQRRSTAAARESVTAHKAETLAQEQAAKVEKLREAAQKANIPWTEKNTAAVYALVKSLRELKTQEDAILKSREMILSVTIDTSSLDASLKKAQERMVEVDLEWRKSAFEINRQNQADFAKQRADTQAQLEEQALYFKNSLMTPREELARFNRLMDELRKVTDSTGKAVLTATEIEKLRAAAVSNYVSDMIDETISAWGGLFSYLGNAFGGVIEDIARAISNIQSGMQTGQQLGSSIGGMTGMGASAGGAAGAGAGAIIAIAIETYKWMKSEAEERKRHSYNFGASLVKGSGQDWNIAVDDEARRASLQIKKTIEALAESFGGVVESFASLEIKVRRDGEWIHAFINGQFVGYFKDMQSAIEAAILAGLKDPKTMFSGMSDLVRQGLEYILSPGTVKVDSLEELEDFMSKIKEISDIRLGPAAEALSAIRHIDRLWEALGKIPAATAAVIQGIEDLRMAEISVWQDLFDSITGRQKSQAEIRAEKERDLKIAKAELEIRKAQIQQRMLQIQADILALKSNNGLIGGGGGRGGGGPKTGSPGAGGIIGLTYAFAMAGNVVAQTTALVTGASTGMIEALEAEWKGLEELLKGLSELKIPDIGAITGGGRGGIDERQGVRDFIKDKKFELSLAGASDYKRALAELDRTYEPLLKSAGKDNALKAELIALREKERKLIEEERKRTLAEKFNQFMGIDQDPFSQLRKGAADLIKEIEDSPFGNVRKQRMIARIFADLERQIDRLARQQAASILGELIGDMEKFGATDAQMAQARQAMAILEHTLKMEHYRTEIEILRATGKLAPEVMAAIDNAFRFLEGVDPLQFVGPRVPLTSAKGTGVFRGYGDDASGAGNQLSDTLRRTNDALKKFRDIISEIANDNRELLLSDSLTALSPQARRAEAMRQYEDVYQRALGGDASALRDYTKSRQQLLEIERQYSASGPEYAALFERVLREGGALALSSDVQEKSIASILAEQTTNEEESAATIHADLLALRSSVVDGLAGLSAALGQGNLLNGIPRFAAGGITNGPSLAGEGPYREAVVPLPGGRAIPVELRGGQTDSANSDSVRLLGVIATEITALRASQETANQRLIRLENAAQRSASIRETFDKRTA